MGIDPAGEDWIFFNGSLRATKEAEEASISESQWKSGRADTVGSPEWVRLTPVLKLVRN